VSADPAQLEADIRHLAAMPRPSASPGERAAADWIAAAFAAAGADAAVEEERAHGGYWWPLGLLNAAGAAAGAAALRGRRWLGAAVAGAAAAAVADDVSGGALWFRKVLPARAAWNVVAVAGDPAAQETVVLVAHHDAAHSGLVFHPGIPAAAGRRFPGLLERANTSPPVMWGVFAGPLAVALGSALGRRGPVRIGIALSAGAAAVMAQIGASETVPGANDNVTGVATLLGVARALQAEPVAGVRVLLVSTGSEESFSEGMKGFVERHAAALSTAHTRVVAIDTVGSPHLHAIESEGMLVHAGYDEELKDLLSAAAAERGVELGRGLRFSFATDALRAMRAGYRSALIASVNEFKAPANYHWRTDHADNVVYETVAAAVEVCDGLIRRIARPASAPG
jgi:Peptidase family M28